MTGKALGALIVAVAGVIGIGVGAASAGVEKLYVLDCRTHRGPVARSPGVNEGRRRVLGNCYLIRHDQGQLLRNAGSPSSRARGTDIDQFANGAITYRRAKTLASQLEQIGVKPADVTYLAVSHTHGDHVGNVVLFPTSTVLIQAAEYDWAMAGPAKPVFATTQKIEKLVGDRDVFGDGTVKIIATPGHTPDRHVAPGAAAEDGMAPALGRRRALPGQLDPQAGAVDELQPRSDPGVPPADRGTTRRAQSPAVDQPRQAAERHAALRARVLRIGRDC